MKRISDQKITIKNIKCLFLDKENYKRSIYHDLDFIVSVKRMNYHPPDS